jgi:Domain of unknown function (DUF6089)
LKKLLLGLLLAIPVFSNAQSHNEVGIMGGVSNYYGDLQDKWFPGSGKTYNPVGGLVYKFFITPRFGIRTGISLTSLTAADSLSDILVNQKRNLRFSTNLFEFHTGFELNLFAVDLDRVRVSPYIFGGVAVIYTNPYTDGLNGEKEYLRPLSTEGQGLPNYPDRKNYHLANFSFPLGGGMKFFVGQTFMICTEMGFRYCATDYIDDVSTSYVNLDTLFAYKGQKAVDLAFRGDEVKGFAESGSNYPNYKFQRGDNKKNDWYWFGNISVSIYFDAFGNFKNYVQTHCPNVFKRGYSK